MHAHFQLKSPPRSLQLWKAVPPSWVGAISICLKNFICDPVENHNRFSRRMRIQGDIFRQTQVPHELKRLSMFPSIDDLVRRET